MNTAPTGAAHVVLVGMMGTGKSTVGRRVARELHRPFVDSDDQIVSRSGRRVTEIFATDGEAAFRSLESAVMSDLLTAPEPSVIAAAGGAVLDPTTRSLMRTHGTVVWMQAPVGVLVDRTRRGTHRPALAEDPEGTLQRMEDDRSSLYAEVADITVDSSRPVDAVVRSILDALDPVVAP